MGLFDNLDVSYRPLLSVTECSICGGMEGHLGRTVTLPAGSALVGLDPADYAMCHGHAVYVK